MNKLQTLLRTFVKSVSDPSYYNHVLRAKFSFSVKYFLAFMAVLAAVNTAQYHFTIKPRVDKFVNQAIEQTVAAYPNTLVLSITDNKLHIAGRPDPVYIPFPQFLDGLKTNQFNYLAILTESATLPKDRALITAIADQLIIRTPDSSRKEILTYSQLDLPQGQTVTLTKDLLTQATTRLQTFTDRLIAYSPLLVFIFLVLALPLGTAIGLLFNTLITWLAAHILNKGLSYKHSYQIGLHTATFALTATTLQRLLFPAVHLPGLHTIAFFGATLLALYSIKAKA